MGVFRACVNRIVSRQKCCKEIRDLGGDGKGGGWGGGGGGGGRRGRRRERTAERNHELSNLGLFLAATSSRAIHCCWKGAYCYSIEVLYLLCQLGSCIRVVQINTMVHYCLER